MEVTSTNTQTILRNMHVEGDSREQYMQMMADRIAALEQALRDIIDMNPRPTLPYGHQVNERARAALAQTKDGE